MTFYLDLKTAIKTGIAATASLYIGLFLSDRIVRPDPLIGGLWCVVTAIITLQTNLGGTYRAVWNRFLGVVIGSIIGAAVASFAGAHGVFLGLAIAATIMICSILNLTDSYRIACLSVAVIIVPWGLHPEISPWIFAFFRFLDTCAGLGIAIFIAHSIWPSQALDKLRINIATNLSVLRELYESVLFPSRSSQIQSKVLTDLLHEIDQLFIQNHLMLDESKLELFRRKEEWVLWTDLLASLENLLDSVYAIHQVFGQDVEDLADEELKNQIFDLAHQVDWIFKQTTARLSGLKNHEDLQPLELAQNKLNEQLLRFRNTRRTKQYSFDIVENYFVFIYSLKSLAKELIHFNQTLDQLQIKDDG